MGVRYGSIDISGLKNFQKQLEKLQTPEVFAEACAKELAARLLAKVIKRTPVGRAPKIKEKTVKVTVRGKDGKKRNRSFLSADGARYQTYWAGYQGGTLRRGWTGGTDMKAADYAATLPISKVGTNYVITITNPIEYASYVEYGHRQKVGRYVPALGKSLKAGWVKGRFMMTISENELKTIAPRVLEAKLKEYLGQVFR